MTRARPSRGRGRDEQKGLAIDIYLPGRPDAWMKMENTVPGCAGQVPGSTTNRNVSQMRTHLVHAVSRNASATEPVQFAIAYTVKNGEPVNRLPE